LDGVVEQQRRTRQRLEFHHVMEFQPLPCRSQDLLAVSFGNDFRNDLHIFTIL
jgi:hypothetical protein